MLRTTRIVLQLEKLLKWKRDMLEGHNWMQLDEHVPPKGRVGTRVRPESHEEDKMGTDTNSAAVNKGQGVDLVQYEEINLFMGESVV